MDISKEKLEWVSPKISLFKWDATDGSGKTYTPYTEAGLTYGPS